MGLREEAVAIAKKYTDKSIAGTSGVLAGKNCKIESIEAITGGNRVTFSWSDDEGVARTSTMDVMDGKGIASVAVREVSGVDHLFITYTDGTVVDAGEIDIQSAVDSVNGKTGDVTLDAEDVGAYSTTEVDEALAPKADETEVESLIKDTVGWTGKNLLQNKVLAFSLSSGSVGSATYQANANATGFCCKVEKNKDYIVSRKSSTDANKRFTVVLSENEPVTGGACQVIFADVDETEYSFNSGNYEYVYLYCGISLTDTDIRPMLRRADISDSTYEPYHESVEVMYEEEIHGVNLLKYPYNNISRTINGVTFTINSDGSVTTNGTATDNAIFILHNQTSMDYSLLRGKSFVVSGGYGEENAFVECYMSSPQSWYQDKDGKGRTFTFPEVEPPSYNIDIIVRSGTTVNNLVFRPMLRKADIEDSTYRPYNPQSIQHQLDAQGVLGAKNLLPYPYVTSSCTINGVTFTDNGDGTITANGTATSDAQFNLTNPTSNNPYVSMILSGDASGNETGTEYFLRDRVSNGGTFVTAFTDTGNGVTITTTDNTYNHQIQIVVRGGQTVSNLVFKPMLRLASDPDSTYQPYAMTNRELTEKLAVQDLSSQIQWETGYFSPITSACKFIKYDGKYTFRLQGNVVQATGDEYIKIAKLPFTLPTFYGTCFPVWNSRSNWVDMNIETNGDVKIRTRSLATGNLIIQLVL